MTDIASGTAWVEGSCQRPSASILGSATDRTSSFLSLALIVALVTGCASSSYPPAPLEVDTPATESGSYDYIIGEGDQLEIFVWGYDELSASVPVRPDGRITTRLVEDLQASGKTPAELARDIEQRYSEFVRGPVVTVSVDGFVGSPAQQIRFVGAGSTPEVVPYARGMRLLDLLIQVGGVDEFAAGNRATLIRNDDGVRRNFALRVGDLLDRGDMSANVPMLPGDVVVVPQTWF